MFEAARKVELPTKDLLSYIFDDPDYDQDRPVRSNFKKMLELFLAPSNTAIDLSRRARSRS